MKSTKKLLVIFAYSFLRYFRYYISVCSEITTENTKSPVEQKQNIFIKNVGTAFFFCSCSLKCEPIFKE